MHRRPEPGAESFFNFQLRTGAVQRLKSFAVRRQTNVHTRSLCLALAVGYELHQEAFAARLAILRVEVHAGRRILKDKSRPPRFAWQPAIATLLEKFKFEFQNIQQIAVIISTAHAVMDITTVCEAGHVRFVGAKATKENRLVLFGFRPMYWRQLTNC